MQPGMTHTLTAVVEPSMTAANMKSGCLDVFATPVMIAFMENVCLECVQPVLDEGHDDSRHSRQRPASCAHPGRYAGAL